jgi:hypothetical protein
MIKESDEISNVALIVLRHNKQKYCNTCALEESYAGKVYMQFCEGGRQSLHNVKYYWKESRD